MRDLRVPRKRGSKGLKKPEFFEGISDKVVLSNWLCSGKLSKPTPAVLNFANRFSGNPKEIVFQVMGVLNKFNVFERVKLDENLLEKHYAKRTAEQIIASRKIFVGVAQRNGHSCKVGGCVDLALVLATVLRAKKIPAIFVRKLTHAFVYFFDGVHWFSADPSLSMVIRVKKGDFGWIKKQLSLPLEQRIFAWGLDPSDERIGLYSLDDFHKYDKKS